MADGPGDGAAVEGTLVGDGVVGMDVGTDVGNAVGIGDGPSGAE